MNLKITMMEIKRLKKNIMVGLISPAAYAALIMVFFIAFSDVMGEMTGLFDNASLQGLLKAFSMDVNTFSYILNFYTAYSGIYVLIMGIIFAAILGVRLFSTELKSGTYEFVYGNPVSRVKLFISKGMVVVIYLVVMNVVVFLIGLGSIELLKTKSPLIPWMSDENQELLIKKAKADPEKLMHVFELDDALFYNVIYSNMENQFAMIPSGDEVDAEAVTDLMTVFILNPDGIFDEMLKNSNKYMELFNIESSGEEQFKNLIELQKANYFNIKENFSKDSELALNFFSETPKPFLDQLIDLDKTELLKEKFGFTDKEFKKIFIYYSFDNYLELSLVAFLVMLSVSMFVLMLTVLVPKGRFSTGMAMGVSSLFYMISIVGNITEKAEVLKYVTPFSYLNMDVMAIDYQTETWALISMFSIIVVSITVSVVAFNKSDFIA